MCEMVSRIILPALLRIDVHCAAVVMVGVCLYLKQAQSAEGEAAAAEDGADTQTKEQCSSDVLRLHICGEAVRTAAAELALIPAESQLGGDPRTPPGLQLSFVPQLFRVGRCCQVCSAKSCRRCSRFGLKLISKFICNFWRVTVFAW